MTEALQAWIDRLYVTSAQHWMLRIISIVSAAGAISATAGASGRWWAFGLVLVIALSAASALRPDLHTGAIVIVVIWWHWLATVEEVLTPWLLVVSVAVILFHATTALMATVPPAAVVPRATIARWTTRTGAVGMATGGMWLLVVAFDARAWRGNAWLTGLALVTIIVGAVGMRVNGIVRR